MPVDLRHQAGCVLLVHGIRLECFFSFDLLCPLLSVICMLKMPCQFYDYVDALHKHRAERLWLRKDENRKFTRDQTKQRLDLKSLMDNFDRG
jgi:hypothetical protein